MSSLKPSTSSNKSSPNRPRLRPRFQRPTGPFAFDDQPLPQVEDVYEKASGSAGKERKRTGVIYDEYMLKHKCEWDKKYPESPERLGCILERIKEIEEHLLKLTYNPQEDTFLHRMHAADMVRVIDHYGSMYDRTIQEEAAARYDAIFFNEHTAQSALMAAACCAQLVIEVCVQENITNGIALVRPPGHHASSHQPNGYCFYNNAAIAAQEALDAELAKKILIVDFDVHHGQGTQRFFYDTNQVLYFSIHRYEHGEFWPNLRESNFDFIGQDAGTGYNINVPLNATGLEDDDYMAIVINLLMPIAYEYQPDLVIFSAGYDAAIGCFEGRMLVSPSFYGQIIKLLSGLAEGKVAVLLEGGYFLPSLAEGVVRTITALLDFPSEKVKPLRVPHESVIEMINNIRYVLKSHWACFTLQQFDVEDEIHQVKVHYKGVPGDPPFPTRNCYPVNDPGETEKFNKTIENYRLQNPIVVKKGVCYAFDAKMLQHAGGQRNENAYRLEVMMEKFQTEFQFINRMIKVEPVPMARDIIEQVHTPLYVDCLMRNEYFFDHEKRDIYVNEHTKDAILTALGCLNGVIEAVIHDRADSGVAYIRPPGHHAAKEKASGFCFVNNIAVMAMNLVKNYKKKVMIIDWDVHHGNGTQDMFYDDPNVLFLSMHKFEDGNFYPAREEAGHEFVGEGAGEGFNVNIPLNKDRMRDYDYIRAWIRLVVPIAYSFAPDIILISAGFDAGVHDRLGNYKLSPEVFGHFLYMLKGVAQGKIIVALEGGYNPTTTAYAMMMCTKALLGDPIPPLECGRVAFYSIERTIQAVVATQKQYWPVLDLQRRLPDEKSPPCPLPLTPEDE